MSARVSANYVYGNDEEKHELFDLRQHRLRPPCRRPASHAENGGACPSKRIGSWRTSRGLPDLQGFGRRKMEIPPDEARDIVLYQIGALSAFVKLHGKKLAHVTLHGALSSMGKHNEPLARAIVEGIKAYDPELIFTGVPGLASYEIAKSVGLRVASTHSHRSGLPKGWKLHYRKNEEKERS